MQKFTFALIALATIVATGSVCAADKLPPKPHGAEIAFVSQIQTDLMARFPTAADAQRAGYFRYTNEDSTGSISYANLHWTSADPSQPSQLWYDANGNLLGADFSQPYATKPPALWGVDPARWGPFREHVHFVYTDATGKIVYGRATSAKAFVAAGGNLADPQAATLVKMGLVPNAAAVSQVFDFPRIWDLIVWVKPNPNGAFADMNPLVKPTSNASHGM